MNKCWCRRRKSARGLEKGNKWGSLGDPGDHSSFQGGKNILNIPLCHEDMHTQIKKKWKQNK